MKKLLIIGLVICIGIGFCGNALGQTVYETTTGIIEDCNGTRLIALVLANGQTMFSNNPVGEFSLEVPLNTNGEITLLVFVAGFLPYKAVLTPQEALNVSIVLYKCEEADYCYDPYPSVVFINWLSCGGDDVTATATVCGDTLSSATLILSNCRSFTPGSCFVSVNASTPTCGTIDLTGNYVFPAGCLTVLELGLNDDDDPALGTTVICPGDCSTDVEWDSLTSLPNAPSTELQMEGIIEGKGFISSR